MVAFVLSTCSHLTLLNTPSFLPLCHSVSHVQLSMAPWTCWGTPGFPVLPYLSELAQTHVLWVGDAVQPSHPLFPLNIYLGIWQCWS